MKPQEFHCVWRTIEEPLSLLLQAYRLLRRSVEKPLCVLADETRDLCVTLIRNALWHARHRDNDTEAVNLAIARGMFLPQESAIETSLNAIRDYLFVTRVNEPPAEPDEEQEA